jgi:hypothetical protein
MGQHWFGSLDPDRTEIKKKRWIRIWIENIENPLKGTITRNHIPQVVDNKIVDLSYCPTMHEDTIRYCTVHSTLLSQGNFERPQKCWNVCVTNP